MTPQLGSIDKLPVDANAASDFLLFGGEAGPSLLVPKALITKIWRQVREGVRSLSHGGLEVGGLLVGQKVGDGRVVVEDTIPLPIEYRQGPLFEMSPSDLATIAPAMEAAHGGGRRVVLGLYRSRTRGNGTLRKSDFAILEAIEKAHKSYAANFRCCLVLSPKSASVAAACVAFRDETGWTELRPVTLQTNPVGIVTSPLDQVPQAGAQQNDDRGALPLAEAMPIAERLVEANSATAVQATRKTWRQRLAWNAFLALISVVTLWMVIRTSDAIERPPAPPSTPHETSRVHLGFAAMRDGPVWKLSWDRAAIDSISPVSGVLSISDGGIEQEIPLAPADLASGLLFYTPQNGNLVFRLRVDSGGSHVEEHVRVVIAAPGSEDKH